MGDVVTIIHFVVCTFIFYASDEILSDVNG